MSSTVPEGWSAVSLGDLCTFSGGNAFKDKYQGFRSGQYPFIKVSDMNLEGNERFIIKASNWINEEIRLEAKVKLFPSKSVVFAKVGAALLLNRRRILTRQTAIDNNMMAAIPNSDDDNFLYYVLQDVDLGEIVQGGALPSVNQSQMKDIPALVPPLPEQQKIAAILSSVDDVIEKTRAQIDKLKDLKTGMMQELLTKGIGHTAFKDSPVGRIPEGWDIRSLSEVIESIDSGWSPQCESIKAKSGDWGVLKTTAVTWDGFDYSANKRLPDHLEGRVELQVRKKDILITRAGPADRVGVVAYVESVPERIMLSDKLIRIKAKDGVEPEFLACWLSTEFVRGFFMERTTGLAQSQTNISQESLKSVPCVIPSLSEQSSVSESLRSVGRRVMEAEGKLEHLLNLKKALMQDLLTGKVRVNVDNNNPEGRVAV